MFVKKHILINGKDIPLYDQNPYISRQQMQGERRQIPLSNDKLTIKYVPLSVSNDEIKAMLEEKGVELRSAINYGKIRDSDGHLTRYKNGDRFVYTAPFSPSLPRQQHVGDFPCVVVHHGKDTLCNACGERGHKIGDRNCKAKPKEKEQILPFRSYEHPLSNHYPCRLTISGNIFKSLEHAYLWRMAMELGKPQIAADIVDSSHAGRAKKLSKDIADDETRWKWERDNTDIMKDLIEAKAAQCEEFYNCLIQNNDKILAEATPSKIWGTGLSIFATQHCSPEFWPGGNLLGALLMDLAKDLVQKEEQSNEDDMADDSTNIDDSTNTNTNTNMDTSNMVVETSQESDIIASACNDNRSREQSPADNTTTRNVSTPVSTPATTPATTPVTTPVRRNRNKFSDKDKHKVKKTVNDKDKNSDKGRKDHNLTPQPSIKTALLEAASKRKVMESSPDGITETEPKSQKQCDEVG